MKFGSILRPAALASFVLVGLAAGPALAEMKDPSGTYLTQDGRARVRIEKCGPDGEAICGYVVWLKPEDGVAGKLDKNNPDPAKATRPVLGHQLILGLQPNSDERFEGLIYNNEDGKKYDVTIWLDRPNRLKVRGCLIAPLCSTQNWARVTDQLDGELTGPTGATNGPTADAEWAGTTPGATAKAGRPAPKRDPKPKT